MEGVKNCVATQNEHDEGLMIMVESGPVNPVSRGTGSDGFWQRFLTRLLYPLRFIYNNGVVCSILAQLLYSLSGIIFKRLSLAGVSMFQILFIQSIFIVMACSFAQKSIGHTGLFGPQECWHLLATRAIMGSIGMVCYFASVALIPVGDAMALSKLAPIFALILTCIFRWEVLNLLMGIGAVICSIGGAIIMHPPFLFGGSVDWSAARVLGNGVAFASAIFNAFGFVVTAKMGTKVSEFSVSLAGHLICMALLPIPLALSFPSPPLFDLTLGHGVLFLIFLPIIFVGNVVVTRGIQLCDGVQGTSLQTVGIIFSYVLGLFYLNEKVSVYAVIGTCVVGIGIWFLATGKGMARRVQIDNSADAQALARS